MEDRLILVDYKDNIVGEGYKQEVHEKGLLHRAFSVFIINGNKMLIQKRAKDKYHSAELWANTCCSHPRVNEDTYDAARRRLKEECGIECEIKEAGSFIYRSVYENGMTEYELDHVFTGCYDGDYHPDLNEIEELKYVDIDYLLKDIKDNPDRYTSWFKTALYMVIKALQL